MGFNFQAGHATAVFDPSHARKVSALLASQFGERVPLGNPGPAFCLPDELGWSWWKELQTLAADTLGGEGTQAIAAVDAWQGVYIDAEVTRHVLWPDGRPTEPVEPTMTVNTGGSWLSRVLRKVGLAKPAPELPAQMLEAMEKMAAALGARPGENGGLQVASLRKLHAELGSLLERLGHDPSDAAVETLRLSYSQSESPDADPALQCLCHARLTASHALTSRSPMWLVK